MAWDMVISYDHSALYAEKGVAVKPTSIALSAKFWELSSV
jgi:hypothetical protein